MDWLDLLAVQGTLNSLLQNHSSKQSILWRRKWQPTPVFLPGESQGRQSVVGCCLWGRTVGHDWSNLAAAAFLMAQLSHLHMTTGKTIALTRWTFVGKVISLLFNKLSGLVIPFLPRSRYLLISWLQSSSAWFWSPKNKVCHCFHCFPIYSPWNDGTGCHDLGFMNAEF